MAYGRYNAGAAGAVTLDNAARTMAKEVMEIANSPDFDREQIPQGVAADTKCKFIAGSFERENLGVGIYIIYVYILVNRL